MIRRLTSRRSRTRTVGLPVAAGAVLATLIAGCSPAPPAAPTLGAVIAERRAAIESAEQERFDAFVQSSVARIAELEVPVPEFQGVVSREAWPEAVAGCIDAADPRLRADRVGDRLTVSYFGMVGDDFDRSRWVIESCTAQFGVAEPSTEPDAGPLELAWRFSDAQQRQLPCLRAAGLLVPSLPSSAEFAQRFGTPSAWNPYALLAADPAGLQRALALCPPSELVIAEHEVRR